MSILSRTSHSNIPFCGLGFPHEQTQNIDASEHESFRQKAFQKSRLYENKRKIR